MFRFPLNPPLAPLSPALEWVLFRAFGPLNAPWEGPAPEGALKLAVLLSMDARIGGRTRPDVLGSDLGPEAADAFRDRYRKTAAAAMLLREVCSSLGAVAGRIETPLVVLKGVALELTSAVPLGFRQTSDIDLLLPEERARSFWKALKDEGWTSHEVPVGEQHLPQLFHPGGLGCVEVHWRLRGFETEAGTWAKFEDLQSSGLLNSVEALPGDCFCLSRDAMIAHLVTHALAQHFWFPASYPQLRFLADLEDLGWGREELDRFLCGAYRWVEGHVSPMLLEAVTELLERLREGEPAGTVWGGSDPAGLFLRHLVLGVCDREYAESLRLHSVSRTVRLPGRRTAAGWSLFRSTFWLTRGQVDQLYGKPRTGLGYLGRRLWRPVDVVFRLFRYGWSWLGVRWRVRGR